MATEQSEPSAPHLRCALATDVGVVREHNEDSAYADPAQRFFIVADGMGGHAAGEVASSMAVASVQAALEREAAILDQYAASPTAEHRRALVELLQEAVQTAHQAVFQRGNDEPDKQGMGTTLEVVIVLGAEAFVAHVGDSRTYHVRGKRALQVTTDHTVAEVLVLQGKLSVEEATTSPWRTVLVNAVGVSADVGVELAHVVLRPDDLLLICSDGLHDYFQNEDEVAACCRIETERSPAQAMAAMIEMAKTRGGHDNITGILINVDDVPDAVPQPVERDSTQPVDQGELAASPSRLAERDAARELEASRRTVPMTVVAPEATGPDKEVVTEAARRQLAEADTLPPLSRRDRAAADLRAKMESLPADKGVVEASPSKAKAKAKPKASGDATANTTDADAAAREFDATANTLPGVELAQLERAAKPDKP